ncbi:2-keto-3-deoxy-phosphogluconate aldolase [Leifsonia sp. LS1]|jgi:2-dehydro-3-deoxyphosphogluconate aldolase/(4S)-4-hydroxy-2-oxoglutarate aldolase|uniref:bifunctional 4-hydroxy-2-oxoglutarate aldolase/2-dehydro-3-deoxy-phosphogluconate aldolase n=1 Tax=Leifsonia sp. LS1 TaxID=2828483 RepID=UPI001CFD6CC6|nr:bifunctional 4-hydroxy-2-oxoglutarate aldolase/2-dehydro-3-deoxy-phosphogluconate aldolase [Leifsonia sp. LS1]GIT82186.1 2-keto-3-deoxy-phosphogluconate aldolase [Leifsonia sp. LS1]
MNEVSGSDEVGSSARTPLPDSLRVCPVVPVLRAAAAEGYDPVIEVLLENGLSTVELTLSTPGTWAALPALVRRWGAAVGVGTVTTVEEAERAIEAGAGFLVTPIARRDIVAVASREGTPVFPGALTPTEVFTVWAAGATAVKIFPAETVGPQYGSHLRGPFPELQFIPSGGVSIEDIPSWLEAGACAVSLGGPLVGDSLRGGSRSSLRDRVRRTLESVGSVRGAL